MFQWKPLAISICIIGVVSWGLIQWARVDFPGMPLFPVQAVNPAPAQGTNPSQESEFIPFPATDPDYGWEISRDHWKPIPISKDTNHPFVVPNAPIGVSYKFVYSGGTRFGLEIDNLLDSDIIESPDQYGNVIPDDFLYTHDVVRGSNVMGTIYLFRHGDQMYYNDGYINALRLNVPLPVAPPGDNG